MDVMAKGEETVWRGGEWKQFEATARDRYEHRDRVTHRIEFTIN